MCFAPRLVGVIEGLASDWHRLDERIEGLSSEIEELAKRDAGCERLMSVPGIGPIISSHRCREWDTFCKER
jgi:transposase